MSRNPLVSLPPLLVEPTVQKNHSDCVVAALAMYLGVPYRLISETIDTLGIKLGMRGLDWMQAIQIAAKLGATLDYIVIRDVDDIRDETGIVSVEWPERRKKVSHALLLFQGVLINPADGLIYDLDAYIHDKGCKITSMLVAA